MNETLKKYTKGKGWTFIEVGDNVYCKYNNRDTFQSGKEYEIHNITLINGSETIFIMVGDDGFPYQFYTVGTSLLFDDYFTWDIKEVRKLKLNKITKNLK